MAKKGVLYRVMWLCVLFFMGYSILFYFAGAPSLKWAPVDTESFEIQNTNSLGEIVADTQIQQEFCATGNGIKQISIKIGTFARQNSALLEMKIFRKDQLLFQNIYDSALIVDNSYLTMNMQEIIPVTPGETLVLEITSLTGKPGNAVTVWYGNKLDSGIGTTLTINGEEVDGTLCLQIVQLQRVPFEQWYLFSVGIVGIFTIVIAMYLSRVRASNKFPAFLEMFATLTKYRFLLSQLIGRDFKTKYRRSYLGVLWSILNPLMMMVVVSSVFSYVFRFNIENFPVYLILGQTFFNFFSEATTVSMSSILGSGQLIKKVYIPKYIFPLEKVLFSFVNFAISFIAIVLVLLFYKIPLTQSIVCLPLILIYLFVFCLGIALFLSAFAVFFRDTLHLYNVVLTAWSYLTPIFYPVSSLSKEMAMLMQFNPMHHYIQYFRNIILYGTFPTLSENWVCVFFSIASLLIGLVFFQHKQDKFILHI